MYGGLIREGKTFYGLPKCFADDSLMFFNLWDAFREGWVPYQAMKLMISFKEINAFRLIAR